MVYTALVSIIASENAYVLISLGYGLEANRNHSMKPISSYGLSYCTIKYAIKGSSGTLDWSRTSNSTFEFWSILSTYLKLLKYFQVALSL
ncbi:hypothetical protein ACFX13_028171 [Malus domestica]